MIGQFLFVVFFDDVLRKIDEILRETVIRILLYGSERVQNAFIQIFANNFVPETQFNGGKHFKVITVRLISRETFKSM